MKYQKEQVQDFAVWQTIVKGTTQLKLFFFLQIILLGNLFHRIDEQLGKLFLVSSSWHNSFVSRISRETKVFHMFH